MKNKHMQKQVINGGASVCLRGREFLPSRILTRGFTLVELLVVIAIIAILAAMLMPALTKVRIQAQKKQAGIEIGQIVTAITSYESAYNRYPCSSNAAVAASAQQEDFTYGTAPGNFSGGQSVSAVNTSMGALAYQANNAEVMAILLDKEYDGFNAPTINQGHVKNPQKNVLLNAKMVGDTSSPGIGKDLVYRDPWGNPYIISMDLNYDEKTRDGFYRQSSVSTGGLNGLSNTDPASFPNRYECRSGVMVWSAGPDKKVDPTMPANQGANKDNVLSWK